jgi:hypothetical protein
LNVLHPRSFVSGVKLEVLNLSRNAISFDSDNQPIWDHLNSLKTLDLSQNNITLNEIPYQWKTVSSEMHFLNLSHNYIGPSLTVADFDFKQTDLNVDLSHNSIRRIIFDEKSAREEVTSDSFGGRPIIIEISFNPIDCNCQAFQLAQLLQRRRPLASSSSSHPKFVLKSEDLTCDTPSELKSLLLRDVDLNDLSCSFPSTQLADECPELCNCSYVPAAPGRVRVGCSGKGLTQFPAFIPVVRGASQVCSYLKIENR